jgi:cell division protein FtsA
MIFADRRQPWRVASRLWPLKTHDEIITIVDLGAHKIACAIISLSPGRYSGDRDIKILGSAIVRSSGLSGGRIANLVAVETSLRRAVAQAEAQASVTAEEVAVTGQFPGLIAEIFDAKLGAGQNFYPREDIDAVTSAVEEHCASKQRKLLHIFTGSLAAGDAADQEHERERGGEYTTEIAAVSMPIRGVRHIAACLGRSLLTPRGFIAGPIATAMSVTVAEERMAGILVMDMGAQSTGCALFLRGAPVFLDVIALGGQQITEDIANTFALRKFEAERLKVRYSSVFDSLQADIDLPLANGETGEPVSKFALNRLVRSRATALLQAINDRLKGAGYSIPNLGVVITGGGSLLPGIRELTSHVLSANVRIGKSIVVNGLSGGAALSALVGSCVYVSRHQSQGEMPYAPETASKGSSYASRISQWLRASF